MQRTFAEAYAGKSRANAMKAKCYSCADFQRNEVALCTVQTCPLYAFRPNAGKAVPESAEATDMDDLL